MRRKRRREPGSAVRLASSQRRQTEGTCQPIVDTLLGSIDLPEETRVAIQRALSEHATRRAELEASEARLRGILDHSPTITYIKDPSGRYTYVNRRYEELVGRPSSSIVGQRAEDLFPPEIAEVYTQHDERVLSSKRPVEVEEILPTPEGDIRVASVQFPLLDGDGQPTAICGISLDITARVRAEAVLAARERHYRQILDNLRQGVILLGPEGEFIYANSSARWLWGIDAARMPGLPLLEPGWTLHAEDGRELAPDEYPLTRSVRDACPIREQVIGLRRGAGHPVRWLTVDAVPVFASRGELRAVVVSLLDSTDRVVAQTQLAQSEALHRSLVTHLPDVVAVLSPNGLVEFANRGLGARGPEELAGTAAAELFRPEHREAAATVIQASVATGQVQDLQCTTVTGVDWHVRVVPLRDGADEGRILIIAQDVTERRRAAEALRASEERFRSLIEHTAEVVFRVDLEGRFTFVSPAVTRLLGYEPRELVGTLFADVLEGEQSRDLAQATLRRWLEGEAEYGDETIELITRRRDREPVVAEVSITVIRDAKGRPQEVQGVLRDITDRKRAEEALRASEAEIQRAQRLESLTVLAGGVAHDFNNLLLGVIGNADLVSGLLPEDSPARPLLDSMLRAALAASELSRQMLAFSGHGRFVARPLDVARHLAEIRGLLESSVTRRGALRFEPAEALPAVQADPTQITQIALNLIVNAVEALPEGRGGVTVECGLLDAGRSLLERAYPVDYELPAGPCVFLRVTDDGHGMTPSEVERAVEPFYTTRFAGRGLGLAVTLGLVRAHRGAFILESVPGAGTTATVLLPPAWGVTEPPRPTLPEVEEEHGPPPSRATVLVADDEPVVLEVARMALSQAGFTVLTAEDGQAAVVAVEEASEPLHLVILDMTMPHLSGEEALRQIRAKLPEVPVVVSTGYSESEAVDRFSGLGIAGYLPKPYRPSELVATVRSLLGS